MVVLTIIITCLTLHFHVLGPYGGSWETAPEQGDCPGLEKTGLRFQSYDVIGKQLHTGVNMSHILPSPPPEPLSR